MSGLEPPQRLTQRVQTALAGPASCQAWQALCVRRCGENNPGDRSCPANVCGPKLAECRQTGCWTEAARYGGGQS